MTDFLRQKQAHELFKRYEGNPIITPDDWPYPTNAVFNPAAVKLNAETLLLIRVEDMRGFSHLTVARSTDGFTNWQIDSAPTLEADQSSREERWGLEDPRIIWLEEQSNLPLRMFPSVKAAPWFHWRLQKISKPLPALVQCCRRRIRMPACFPADSGDDLP